MGRGAKLGFRVVFKVWRKERKPYNYIFSRRRTVLIAACRLSFVGAQKQDVVRFALFIGACGQLRGDDRRNDSTGL